jgi:hypothetical protein
MKTSFISMLIVLFLESTGFSQLDRNWILFNAGLKLDWVAGNPAIDSMFSFHGYAVRTTSQISNQNGQLLFYAAANTIWDRNNQVMSNAPDTSFLYNSGMYHRCMYNVILPVNDDTSLFHVFFANHGSTYLSDIGYLLNYSVSPWQNVNGEVNNIDTIYSGSDATWSLSVVKHGNGRDWWLLYWRSQSDSIMSFIQNADGSLSGPYFQYIDVFPDLLYANDNLFLSFTENGDRLAIVNMAGPIHLYNFDRCTGQLNNKVVLDSCLLCSNSSTYWNGVFSPDGSKLYVARVDTLYQYDLSNLPISFDKHIIWYCSDEFDTDGADLIRSLQLAPNGTIITGTYVFNDTSANDSGSHYLGVIRSPNSAGSACNFDRYGLYLNGYQSDGILPNIPNYDLGPWVGSPCDTLITTSLYELNPTPQITLAPNPAQTQATLIWSGIKEGTFMLRDMLGRAVLSEVLNAPGGTTRLDLSTLPKGIYLWQVQSAGYSKNGKLVVE